MMNIGSSQVIDWQQQQQYVSLCKLQQMTDLWKRAKNLVFLHVRQSNQCPEASESLDTFQVLDRIPPDIEKAKKHGISKRINTSDSSCMVKIQQGEICECCGNSINNEPFAVCCDKKSYYVLGPGFVLYFQFIIGCLILLGITFLGFGIPSLLSNMSGDYCLKEKEMNDACQKYLQTFNGSDIGVLVDACYKLDEHDNIQPAGQIDDCFKEICCVDNNGRCADKTDDWLIQIDSLCIVKHVNIQQKRRQQQKETINNQQQYHGFCYSYCLTRTEKMDEVIMIWFHRRDMDQEVDNILNSPSDYTAILTNLPENYDEKQLHDQIQAWCEKQNELHKTKIHHLVEIIIAYDIEEYLNILKEKQEQIVLKKRLLHLKNTRPKLFLEQTQKKSLEEIEKNIMLTHFKVCQLENLVFSGHYKKYTSVAFAKFQYEECMRQFIKQYGCNYKRRIKLFFLENICRVPRSGLIFNDKRIDVKRAPEPTDVVWKNCRRQKNRLAKNILIQLFTFLIFAVIFGIFLGINLLQSIVENYTTILTMISGVLVVLINGLLILIVKYMVQMESLPTMTFYHISVGSKLIVAQIMNTGVLVVMVNYLIHKGGRIYDDADRRFIPIQQSGGIAEGLFWIMFLNAFLTPVITLLNPFYIQRLIMRWYIIRQGDQCVYTQRQANTWFEGNQCDMYAKYSHIIKTMLLTGFFCNLIPMILIFASIGLLLTYWVDKVANFHNCQYLISARYVRPTQLSSDLNEFMQACLQLFPLALSFGSLYYDYFAYKPKGSEQDVGFALNFVAMFACIINFLFGKLANKRFFHWLKHRSERKKQQILDKPIPHSYAKSKFITDYDRTNPVTMNIAMKEWLQSQLQNNQSETLQEFRKNVVNQMKQTIQQYSLDIKTFQDIANLANHSILRIKEQRQQLQQVVAPIKYIKASTIRGNSFRINESLAAVHRKK